MDDRLDSLDVTALYVTHDQAVARRDERGAPRTGGDASGNLHEPATPFVEEFIALETVDPNFLTAEPA